MKKFSTLALLLTLGSAIDIVISPSVFAAEEMNAEKTQCTFLANAPDKHVVEQGDTLWGISEMFLEHAWCWPKVWGKNKEDIKNPDWIYPGQVVYLDRAAGRLRLGKPAMSRKGKLEPIADSSLTTVKISPQIRAENINDGAITSIPSNQIEPFLSQPLVLDTPQIANAPRIVSAQPGHVNIGQSENAYVVGDLGGRTTFQVYRPSTPLINPDDKKTLGYEYAYLGRVKLIKAAKSPGEANKFVALTAKEEMTAGDLLLPAPDIEPNNYAPHPPIGNVKGRIVAVNGGVAQAGKSQTVSINLGATDGMDVGTVLKMYRFGETVADNTREKGMVKLPDEEYGTLFVYRVFNHVSYGLIMRISDAAEVGDTIQSPQ